MNAHVVAVAQVMLLVGAAALSAWGWGRTVAKGLRLDPDAGGSFALLTWLGWAVTLVLLHLAHFLAPLTGAVVAPIFGAGMVLAVVPRRRRAHEAHENGSLALWKRLVVGSLFLVAVPWVVSRALPPPHAYDYGLYHHNSIQWTNEYPAVPGLANLHSRLAFNQAPLVYVASLNLHPHFGQGRVVAIAFVSLLLVASILESLVGGRGTARQASARSALERYAALFLLPFLVYVVAVRPEFSSPSPDLFSTMLQVAIFLLLCRAIDAWRAGKDARGGMSALTLLAATSITVKLSSLMFAAAVLGIATFYAWMREPRIRSVLSDTGLAAAVLLVWTIRGFVLSGMPFYPSTAFRLPVDWAASIEAASMTKQWVYSWARKPETSPSDVLASWSWFAPWLASKRGELVEFAGPLLGVLVLAVCLAVLAWSRGRRPDGKMMLLLVPPVGGLLFWFSTAPNSRFLGAQLWLLFVAETVLFVEVASRARARPPRWLLILLIVFLSLPIAAQVRKDPWLLRMRPGGSAQNISINGFHGVKRVELEERRSVRGGRFFVPVEGDQCWDAPLPCTTPAKSTFEFRDPESLRAGFLDRPDPPP